MAAPSPPGPPSKRNGRLDPTDDPSLPATGERAKGREGTRQAASAAEAAEEAKEGTGGECSAKPTTRRFPGLPASGSAIQPPSTAEVPAAAGRCCDEDEAIQILLVPSDGSEREDLAGEDWGGGLPALLLALPVEK